jgi:hypothetical protein
VWFFVSIQGSASLSIRYLRMRRVVPSISAARIIWGLGVMAGKTADAGALTPSEAWMADLEARDAAGAFFAAITGFVVRGRKPKTA